VLDDLIHTVVSTSLHKTFRQVKRDLRFELKQNSTTTSESITGWGDTGRVARCRASMQRGLHRAFLCKKSPDGCLNRLGRKPLLLRALLS